jgi:hypothetical protein
VSAVDIGIVVFALAMAFIGWDLGFLRSALPLAGFVGGALAGGRLGPEFLSGGAESRYAPVITLLVALFAGAVMAVVMDALSARLRAGFRPGSAAARVDGLGGAVLLAGLALLVAWAFGAVILHSFTSGSRPVREAIADSRVLGRLNDLLPPSGPLLNILRRVDPGPTVRGPSANVPPPDPRVLDAPGVQRAGASVVKVIGTACGLGLEGSGWSAGGGVVVTNAHVIAGEDDTTVIPPTGGEGLAATVVHYDPKNDLAILRVDGLGLPALPLGRPRPGAEAAVLGYPENGPYSAAPARIGRSGTVSTQDSYGRGPVNRRVTPFRGEVLSGNSGGPLVDSQGRVAATVFAANQTGRQGGLGVPADVVRTALQGPLAPTGDGPCIA